MDGLEMVETPPNMNTPSTLFGFDGKQLASGGSVALVGVIVALWLEYIYLALPFLVVGIIFTVYKKDGLVIWEYLWRRMFYDLFEPKFLEGKKECSGTLMNINDVHENYYRVGSNKYVSLLYVSGAPYDNLNFNQQKGLLGGFRSMLNSSSFDFKIQIIGKEGRLPMGSIDPAPGLRRKKSPYNDALDYIGKELDQHVNDMLEDKTTYYYYVAIPYYSRDEGSAKDRRERIKNTLDDRSRLVSQYLMNSGLSNKRLSGEELIEVLRFFVDEDELLKDFGEYQ